MTHLAQRLRAKLPSRQETLPVLATIMFFVCSWALYRMFWYVPSWLVYYTPWDILVLAAYVLSYALFESACFLGLVVVFSLLFPARHFKDKFTLQGSTVAFVISVAAYLLQRKIGLIYKLQLWQYITYPLLILLALTLLILVASLVFERFALLGRLVQALADRMTIFLYIYPPLGLLSLVVVLIRNIF